MNPYVITFKLGGFAPMEKITARAKTARELLAVQSQIDSFLTALYMQMVESGENEDGNGETF